MATKKKAAAKSIGSPKKGGKAPNTKLVAAPASARKQTGKAETNHFTKPATAPAKAAKASAPDPPQNRPAEKPTIPRLETGQFAPGVSGNPGGRPRMKPVTDAFRAALDTLVPGDKDGRTYAQAIALAAIHKAIKGSPEHLREVLDRVEGRSKQAIEHTGRDGGPIDFAHLTPDQRDSELDNLAAELGYKRG